MRAARSILPPTEGPPRQLLIVMPRNRARRRGRRQGVRKCRKIEEEPRAFPCLFKKLKNEDINSKASRDSFSPVAGSSILLYSSRVCPNFEILLLSPLEDENHAISTLFPQLPGKEAINFQRYLVSFRFLAIIFILELIC